MKWLLEQGEAKLDGFVLPWHVCVVMGYEEYEQFPVPQVVAGFEAEDILLGLVMLVEQIKEGKQVSTAEMINHELAARWEMCCEAVGIDTDATAAEWREAYEAKGQEG